LHFRRQSHGERGPSVAVLRPLRRTRPVLLHQAQRGVQFAHRMHCGPPVCLLAQHAQHVIRKAGAWRFGTTSSLTRSSSTRCTGSCSAANGQAGGMASPRRASHSTVRATELSLLWMRPNRRSTRPNPSSPICRCAGRAGLQAGQTALRHCGPVGALGEPGSAGTACAGQFPFKCPLRGSDASASTHRVQDTKLPVQPGRRGFKG
jgi:hypothetical protein